MGKSITPTYRLEFNDGKPLLPSLAKAESCFEMVEYENPK